MNSLRVDAKKLGEALKGFGSLKSALEHLRTEKQRLEALLARHKKQHQRLITERDKLQHQNEELDSRFSKRKTELQDLSAEIERHHRQYGLFAGFMAMLLGSPSIRESLDTIITLLQRLKTPGWLVPKTPDDLRSMFIRTVMGDYLKSYRCETCGAQFVVNKKPKPWLGIGGYCCPACHRDYMVKEDDSFVRLMISDKKQLADVHHTEEVIEENELLAPFKVFLNIPCEICKKAIEVWDDYNTKMAIQGIGFGHTACWRSDAGQFIELARALEKLRQK